MKRFFLLLFLSSLFTMADLSAQDNAPNTKDLPLNFIYISHDRTTNTTALTRTLKEIYDIAYDPYQSATAVPHIFYLADDVSPKVIYMNIGKNNFKEFERDILGEIGNSMSHNVLPGFDVDSIIKIFNDIDFLDEDGNLQFYSFSMKFYVSREFWEQGFNESLIAYLYWVMGMDKYMPNPDLWQYSFEVFCSKSEEPYVDMTKPFGDSNLSDINKYIMPMEY